MPKGKTTKFPANASNGLEGHVPAFRTVPISEVFAGI
jgi:hypothetical protein